MALYFFDVRNGEALAIDAQGLDLPDIETALEEATLSLAEMAKDASRQRARSFSGSRMAVEIRDEKGPVLCVKLSLNVEGCR